MSTVSEIYHILDQLFPFSLSMDFDNTGILVGDRSQPVIRALVALDCTLPVLELARQLEAQLIITHHPVIFQPIRRVNEDSVVYHLIRSGIAVISAHTNLDIARGGVNDALADAIGLSDCRGLELISPEDSLGRIGKLTEPVSASEFALALKAQLGAASVKFADAGKPIQTVALCSGSGADYLELAAASGADALLTSEVKQHQYLNASALGISIFDAGHFDTEDIVIEPLREKLASLIPDVTFFSTHLSPITAV
jgi:dinuclear metal center YbgI/SA1388 family protein